MNTVENEKNKKATASKINYAKGSSRILPAATLASSNDLCVDHFNFLRQAGDDKYKKFSRDYIQIGDGYNFLNVNKNIMSSDARRVYTNELEMKLNTLCSEVNYAGFQFIQQKIISIRNI
ncbi:hypothetical protein QCK34_004431 [Enterobacter asburiae]|nr:hypothetical protein [Enterobacter asburiae]